MKGIVSYGSYIPRHYHKVNSGKLGLLEQRIAAPYEDTAVLGYFAGKEAIERSGINKKDVAAIYLGTETPVYKVKPTSMIIADMLGLSSNIEAMDVEFACAAGLKALKTALRESEHPDFNDKYLLVIMSDAAPIKPESQFYNLIGHGAAALLIGNNPIIELITGGVNSHSTNVNDFSVMHCDPAMPVCNGRTSIFEYKRHVFNSVRNFLKNTNFNYEHIIGHTPFPNITKWITTAEKNCFLNNPFKGLGEDEANELFKYNNVSSRIGNAFAAMTGLNLCNLLDNIKPGGQAIVYTYGSGATSLTMGVRAKSKINEFDRRVSLIDKLNASDENFSLSDEVYNDWMQKRINEWGNKGGLDIILKSDYVYSKPDFSEAILIDFKGRDSIIQFNGKNYNAEVIGCAELENGVMLEHVPKRRLLNLKGPIIYTNAYREKIIF